MTIKNSQDIRFNINPVEIVEGIKPFLENYLQQLKKDLVYPESYFTRSDAAKFLQISLPTLDKYVQEGIIDKYQLPDSNIIRFKRSDLEYCLKKVSYKSQSKSKK